MGEILRSRVEGNKNYFCIKDKTGDVFFGILTVIEGRVRVDWGKPRKNFESMVKLMEYIKGV